MDPWSRILSHPCRVNQSQVLDEDAAPEALAPEGSSPKGELTGKPYSSNSIAGTKVYAFWVHVYGSVGCKV